MHNDIEKKLIAMAHNAPLKSYVFSSHYCITELKEENNISNYYIVDILEKLLEKGDIRELQVNYDKTDKHILSFGFR